MKKARKNPGSIITASGLVLVLGALVLTAYNINESNNAAQTSREMYDRFIEQVQTDPVKEEKNDIVSEYHLPDGVRDYLVNLPEEPEEDPEFELDGSMYTAVIRIPALNLGLPVKSELTMADLKETPCRYTGSIKGNDIIIGAHNYDSHFGNIKSLVYGDEIILTDASGEETVYTVSELELIDGTDVENMKAGQWDLTLFTCNLSGRARVTVRCARA